MHSRDARSWNVPLGIALFGGAVLVGGAILAYPETREAPSRTDVGDPHANKPFPSYPDELPQDPDTRAAAPYKPISPRPPLPAPEGVSAGDEGADNERRGDAGAGGRGVGGGPSTEDEEPETPEEGRRSTISAPTIGGVTRDAAAPDRTTADVSPTSTADEDGGAVSAPVEDAAGAALGEAGALDEAGALFGDGGMMGMGTSMMTPILGVPPGLGLDGGVPGSVTPGTGGGVSGAGGGGGGGTSGVTGGGGTSGASTTTNAASINAPLMVPLVDATKAEPLWATISPLLRSGDLVVANAQNDAALTSFLTLSERVHADAPNVAYVVALPTAERLDATLAKGIPAALGAVGLSSLKGVNDSTLSRLAASVRAQNRKFFVSVTVPTNGPTFAAIGARADLVELVVNGTSQEITDAAKGAAQALGPKALVFVRLPDELTPRATASTTATSIANAIPKAGVAIPASADVATLLSDYRSTK